MTRRTLCISMFAVLAFVLAFNILAIAAAKPTLITQKIDNSKLVTLAGNTRPEAN